MKKAESVRVAVLASVIKPYAGSRVAFVWDGEGKIFTVIPTSSWSDFCELDLGRINLPAGTHVISLIPIETKKWVMNCNGIKFTRLTPAKLGKN